MNNPILITGTYRSGTTYLSRVINASSEINVTYDSINYFRYYVKRNYDPENFEKIVDDVVSRLKIRHKIHLNKSNILHYIQHSKVINHTSVYSAIMREFWKGDRRRWGEKTLLEWRNIPVFLSMFKNGQALHIIRDVRDVLASYKYMTIEEKEKYLDAIFCTIDSYDHALKYLNVLPKDKYYLVVYENLINDTENEIKKICDFLNIDFTSEMLDEKKYTDLSGKNFDITTHTSFPEDKNKPIGRWKSKLNKNEILFVEAIAGDRMIKLGYELSIPKDDNPFSWLIEITNNTPLIAKRLLKYLFFNEGIEEYPSDPTDPKNWSDFGETGKGAKYAYIKRK